MAENRIWEFTRKDGSQERGIWWIPTVDVIRQTATVEIAGTLRTQGTIKIFVKLSGKVGVGSMSLDSTKSGYRTKDDEDQEEEIRASIAKWLDEKTMQELVDSADGEEPDIIHDPGFPAVLFKKT